MRRLAFMTAGFAAACFLMCKGFLLGMFLLLPVLLLGLWRHGTRKRCALLLLGLLLGTLWSSFYMVWKVAPAKALDGSTRLLTVRLTHGSQENEWGSMADGVTEIGGRTYAIRIYSQQPNHRAGDRLSFLGKVRFCEKPFLAAKGVFLEATVPGTLYTTVGERGIWSYVDDLRTSMEHRLERHIPSDAVPFAKALFLGEHLDDARIHDLSMTGLSHMVAVSGMHLVLLMAIFSIFSLHQALPSFLLGVPGMVAFGAVCGFPASICRASIMMFLFLLSRVLRREYDQQTALAASVLVLLMIRPTMALSVGLQLSTFAVLGLLCFTGKLTRRMMPPELRPERDAPKPKNQKGFQRALVQIRMFAVKTVAATLGASALSVPLAVYYFGVVSLLAPLANLLALPMVPFGFCGSFCTWIFGLIWDPLGDFFGTLTAIPLRYLDGLCRVLAKVPFGAVYPKSSSTMGVFFLCGAVLLVLFSVFHCVRGKTLVRVLCLGFLAALSVQILAPRLETVRVTALDAGRGQCVILETHGEIYVVNCGGDHEKNPGETAARYLQSQGYFHIDGLILTDTGRAQTSGIPQLLHRMQVKAIYTPEPLEALSEVPQTLVEENQSISLKTGEITVFAHPNRGKTQEAGLSVLFTAGNYDTLIGGNWDTEAWLSILPSLPDLEICLLSPSQDLSPGIFRKLSPERLILWGEGKCSERLLTQADRMGCRVLETGTHSRIKIRR